MSKPTAALLGTGKIAKFHVEALKCAGFDVQFIAASPNSKTVNEFANIHNIPTVYDDPYELAKSTVWDAIVIASAIEPTVDLVLSAASTGKPVLVEKPISYNLDDFKRLSGVGDNVIVGYNRRFYEPVECAKKFLKQHGKSFAQVELPQGLRYCEDTGFDFRPFVSNAIHGVDLANFLFGKLTLKEVDTIRNEEDNNLALTALCHSEGGHLIQLIVNFNAASNFSVTIDHGSYRYQLRPFEFGALYQGTTIIEPSEEIPARQYIPQLIEETNVFVRNSKIKPGFLGQAEALLCMTNGNKPPATAARICDARDALDIINNLKNVLE